MRVCMAATSLPLLLVLITVALGSKTESDSRGPYHPTECCYSYLTRPIRKHWISRYYETGGLCSKPGIVFITKNGRQLCANPSDDWVQDYIKGAGGDLSDPEVAEKDTAQNLKRWG
ncbi:C-C motif chemokine 14-like [Lagenorhynchus albirostris]|uniref:C-C motif chemokine 14-like n=1 Tax=Lagenorhynchus albirostris TaxID=27610 RepID=UPI0028E74661|nr:C-C motif chemokine 14-like [Lagenorhynchus albirostris]